MAEILTATEFANLPPMPCPVCGSPVDRDRIDVTSRAHHERTGERQYIVGMWSCPRGCNPVTGERAHLNQEFGSDFGNDVDYWFRCSCGVEEHGLNWVALRELMVKHGPA